MRRAVWLIAAVALLAIAVPAQASRLIGRDGNGVKLRVDRKNRALVTFRTAGRNRQVLAWGAVNARPPTVGVPQQRFRLDYDWGVRRRPLFRHFRNACRPYDGPHLAFFVTGCKAADGSYWAVQAWQRQLPNLGFPAWLPEQRVWELHLSHWWGPLAQLEVYEDWLPSGNHDLFGRLTYAGMPVWGFGTTSRGAPTDGYGRLIYIDTFDAPAYGLGWRRETSIVTHRPNGVFCHAFVPLDPALRKEHVPPGFAGGLRGPGRGAAYRVVAEGPGVTPDVAWQAPALHDFHPGSAADRAFQQERDRIRAQIAAGDRACGPH